MSDSLEVRTPCEKWNIDAAVKDFMEHGFNHGDLVTHSWLEYHLDIPEPKTVADAKSIRWLAMGRIEQFKEALLVKHRVYLANVQGDGYRVVPPAEQARYAARSTVKTIVKAFERGNRIISHTNTASLNNDELRRHTDTENKMAALNQIMTKQKRDIFLEFSQ